MSNPRDTFGMLLPFDTDEPEFIRGFECGHVWTKLRESDERTFSVHAESAEMILRIAEALELPVHSHELGDGWLEVVFEEPRDEESEP